MSAEEGRRDPEGMLDWIELRHRQQALIERLIALQRAASDRTLRDIQEDDPAQIALTIDLFDRSRRRSTARRHDPRFADRHKLDCVAVAATLGGEADPGATAWEPAAMSGTEGERKNMSVATRRDRNCFYFRGPGSKAHNSDGGDGPATTSRTTLAVGLIAEPIVQWASFETRDPAGPEHGARSLGTPKLRFIGSDQGQPTMNARSACSSN